MKWRKPTKHVHGPSCDHARDHDHDHAHGKPASASREGHAPDADTAKDHVHGPQCGHAHSDHDHGHHDHGHHDHGHHDHGHHDQPRPEAQFLGERPCGEGAACQFDLDATLPGETDEIGRFRKLELQLEAERGIKDVHLRQGGRAEICIHYEPNALTLAQLIALVRAVGAKVSDRYRVHTWFVRGMDAAQCATVIEHSLGRMAGILSANVAYASERLVVEYDSAGVKLGSIEARVRAIGYELEVPEHGHACPHHGGGLAPKLQVPLTIAAALLIALGLAIEHLAVLAALGSWIPTACYAGAILAGGFFAARGALRALLQGRLDIESLMILAAIGAAFLGAWFEGAFLLLLFSIGHSLEHRAMDRARRSIEALARLRPEVARVRRGAAIEEVAVREVQRGDLVVVRPGDRVPLDGVIRSGQTHLDQAAVTGESIPVAKGPGDDVFAATVNSDAVIEVEVMRLSSESLLGRVIDMVAQAEAQKSPTQRFARDLERRFVPVVLLLVVATPAVLYIFGIPLLEGVLRAVALLVAASPCALAISTPAAVLSAVAAAARGGVLVKGGAHLEGLGRVRVMAFDKTGTLTVGKPRLLALAPASGVDEAELLGTAAAVEALSAHPLARAIVEAARARALAIEPADGLEASHGKGLTAHVGGELVQVGSRALHGTLPAAIAADVERLETDGQTTMIIRRGERFLGVLGVADTVRAEAKATLAGLKALGIVRNIMLSGDNQRVAKAIGAELGLDEVRAPLLPEGKVTEMRDLAREHGVAMVGDGVNDAPALAAATVGIAMGGAGSDAALETADVVLMGDDLGRLPFAVGLARAATRVIRQNLAISLGVSALLILASLAGWTHISHAVVLHEGSTLLVVANGLRLLRFRLRPL